MLFAVVCIFNIALLQHLGMSGKIILAREETSVRFHDKVLLITDGQTVKVSRSSSDDKPDTCNAVFDCRVGLQVLS